MFFIVLILFNLCVFIVVQEIRMCSFYKHYLLTSSCHAYILALLIDCLVHKEGGGGTTFKKIYV